MYLNKSHMITNPVPRGKGIIVVHVSKSECTFTCLVQNRKKKQKKKKKKKTANLHIITKTRLYNSDPHEPHFYIVKLGFTGVYIIFLISS